MVYIVTLYGGGLLQRWAVPAGEHGHDPPLTINHPYR